MKNFYNNLKNGLTSVRVGNTLDSILSRICLASLILMTIGVGNAWGAVTRKFYAGVGVVGDGVAQVQMDWKWGLSSGTIGTAKSNDANPYLEDNPSRVVASSIPNYRARYSIFSTGTGYTFKYWCNAKGDSITNSDPWTAQDYNSGGWVITYYAKFTPNDYTIVYIGNGSTHGATASTPATYDDNVTFAQNGFYRAKYVVTYDANGGTCSLEADTAYYPFEGWAESAGGAKVYDGGQTTTSAPNLATSGNTNLYAKWGSGTTAVTLPTSSDLTAPVYDGDGEYSFAGWYVSTDENKEVLGVSYTPTSNVTLKAKWTLTKEPRFSGAVEGTSHTLKVGETFNFEFENTYPTTPSSSSSDNFYYVISQTTDPTGNRDGSEHPNDVISISGNTITALNNGVATIKFYQKADATNNIAEGESSTYTFTVSRNVPEFTWNTREHYYYNETIAHFFKSSQTETAISVTSTDAHKLIATIVDSALVMYNKAGTARVTMTQAENYYWAEHTEYRDITPEKANTHVEFTMNSAALRDVLFEGKSTNSTSTISCEDDGKIVLTQGGAAWDANELYYIIHFTGIPDSISFKYRTTQNLATSYGRGDAFVVYESASGENDTWHEVWRAEVPGDSDDHNVNPQPLRPNTRFLKFFFHATYTGNYKNIRVTEKKHFKTDSTSFDFKTNLKNAIVASKSFKFKHANAGYTVKAELSDSTHYQISLDNSSFSGSVIIPNTGGDRMDSSVVYVKYYPSATGDAEETHNATITFSDQLSNSAIVTLTGKTQAKLSTHLVYKGSASYSVDAANIAATDLFEVRDANNALVSNPTITLSKGETSIFDLANSNTELDPKCGGSATVTASYTGDETYAAASNLDQTITIARLADEISFGNGKIVLIAGNEEELSAWNITSNSQTEGATLTFSTSNSGVLRVEGGKIIAVSKGEAKLYATSENTCTYAAGVDSLTIKVRNTNDPCETTSYLNTAKTQIKSGKSLVATITEGKHQTLTVSLRAQLLAANSNTSTIELLNKDNGVLFTHTFKRDTMSNNSKTYSYDLSGIANIETAKTIRVTGNGSTYYQEYDLIKITQQRYLNHTGAKNIAMTSVKACEPATHDVTINYSDVSTIQMRHKNDDFSYTVVNGNSNGEFNNDCGDFGTFTLRATVNPLTKGEYKDSIFLTASGLCDTIVLTLNATKPEREIVWNQDEISTATATTNTTLDEAFVRTTLCQETAGSVTYTIHAQSEDGVASLSGNVLSFHKEGTVTVKASAAEDDDYLAAADVTKTWNVSKVGVQVSTLPDFITSTITYLNTKSVVSWNDESWEAEDELNHNKVEGYINYKSPASFDAAGDQNLTFIFTPNDPDVYKTSTFTVPVTVQKMAALNVDVPYTFCAGESVTYRGETYSEAGTYPVNATGANRDTVYNVIVTVLQPTTGTDSKTITYGENESWHGTDLSGCTAGEHEVEYHTTNAVGCDSTVTLSLTVNKATPTLSWETAPAELAYNATDVVYAATSTSNEGDITYSITSGSEYAEINANTGVLTNIVPGHNITVQATQAVSTNYNAPVAITVNVTIAAIPTNTFTNAHGDNDWQTAGNWSNGEVPSGENPNVIISGELIINEDVTVGGLTILPTGSVAVVTNGTLTIKGTSESRSEYGDMHVADDGNVVLGSSADLKVRHFFLDAKLGDSSTQAASGQVKGNGALNVIGDAYFQMKFDPSGAITYGWYDFVVPFEVNTNGGIYRVEANDDLTPMTSGVDFLVQSFSEARCAAGQKAWTNFSGTMMPGQGYTITFNYQPSFNQNTFLFKKKAGATIGGSNTYSAVRTFSGEESEQGWNVLGNGTLQHIELAENLKIQIFEHASNSYQPFVATEKTIAVGTSFQVQVFDAQKTIVMSTATDRPILAPKREVREVEEFRLSLTAEGEEKEADRLWISASEEATGAYWIGHDLLKKGTMTGAKVARMWCTRNGKQLCDVEMPMVNGSAENALGLFTPNAGQYTLAIEEAPADASLYLTYNGAVIWDLTASPYVFDLTKGTTEGYGLRIEAANAPQVTTGVENGGLMNDANSVRKVIIDNKMYIITPEGAIFDVIGKKVQ